MKDKLLILKDKALALLTDKRFWLGAGKWFAGIFCGFTFVLGLGTWREAFVNAPLQTVAMLWIPGIVALVFGAIAMLQYKPMSDAEIEERVTASWPGVELSQEQFNEMAEHWLNSSIHP